MFHTLFWLVIALLLYMSAWFAIAKQSDRADMVDSAWGLGFVYVAWIAWALNGHVLGARILTVLLVTIWGLRLYLHISLRNSKKEEDRRYKKYRKQWKDDFWQTAYLRIFLLQGLLMLVISFPVIAVMVSGNHALLWLAALGFLIWLFGIGFEAKADAELTSFVKDKKPGEIMKEGLWQYSRHPNYFGEITAWWGAALVALSVDGWWGIIGAALISWLIVKVSGIPPLEKRYADNPEFQKYQERTSMLVPRPPKAADD